MDEWADKRSACAFVCVRARSCVCVLAFGSPLAVVAILLQGPHEFIIVRLIENNQKISV